MEAWIHAHGPARLRLINFACLSYDPRRTFSPSGRTCFDLRSTSGEVERRWREASSATEPERNAAVELQTESLPFMRQLNNAARDERTGSDRNHGRRSTVKTKSCVGQGSQRQILQSMIRKARRRVDNGVDIMGTACGN